MKTTSEKIMDKVVGFDDWMKANAEAVQKKLEEDYQLSKKNDTE